jgi:hypothetical protein
MSDRVFYVGANPQNDEKKITGYVPAKFLTLNGKPVVDPVPGGSQNASTNVGASRGSLPPLDGSDLLPKKFDTSGKSPAYLHHRKNFRARAGKPAAGFFAGSRERYSSSPTSAAVTRS